MDYLHKQMEPVAFPNTNLNLNHKYTKNEDFLFDEKIHLDIKAPQFIIDLTFQYIPYPYRHMDKTEFMGLGYTLPFQLLSDKGVDIIKKIVMKNMNIVKENERNSNIRGLAYISTFIRDFSYCKRVIDLFSDITQNALCLHNCFMNIAQINVGKISPNNKPVDQWHTDSVDYVMVLILSNTTSMIGGELQVLEIMDANGQVFNDLKVKGIPSKMVKKIKFPKPGSCILIHGSLLMHSVSPVTKGIEPRFSLINSYITKDVFKRDYTRLSTFRDQSKDPPNIANLEYARHIAWRTRGQLQYILDDMNYAKNNTHDISNIFNNVISELKSAEQIITKKKESDLQGFIKLKSKL